MAAARTPPLALDAVLFDLDGVLVDSRAAITRSINHALSRLGVAPRPPEALLHLIGPPLHDAFAELLGQPADAPDVVACVGHYRERYARTCVEETSPIVGMADAVARIARRHPVVVATSKPAAFARPILEGLGLAAVFADIVGPDLDARSEPKATTVARALERLGAPRRAALVGDRHHDVTAGRHHGLRTIGVTWGIGSAEELERAGADELVHTPAALAERFGEGDPSER